MAATGVFEFDAGVSEPEPRDSARVSQKAVRLGQSP